MEFRVGIDSIFYKSIMQFENSTITLLNPENSDHPTLLT